MSNRTDADATQIYRRVVENYAQLFELPATRLRFLNNTLARQSDLQEQAVRSLRLFTFLHDTRLHRFLIEWILYSQLFKESRKLLPDAAEEQRLLRNNEIPLAPRLYIRLHRYRHIFYGTGLFAGVIVLVSLYSLVAWSAQRINIYFSSTREARISFPRDANERAAQVAPEKVEATKYLPGYRPEKIWLVERAGGFERYSNGARILTEYETDNHPRAYYIVSSGAEDVDEGRTGQAPIGVLYHTSEGDMVPFTADNNASIETRARLLLSYVRQKKAYNYVIDRFGQIYRVVRDEHAANHAGNSVWANGSDIYVGLNESFIGVSFESSTDTKTPDERLTEAQIISGRLLTAILRSRYNIEDANCVTHGLVSVNPDNMLVCYHRDWARNFPFEAMGLSDKYQIAPASVAEFGFTYDDFTVAQLGGSMWAGVAAAEQAFEHKAQKEQVELPELRRRGRERFLNLLRATYRLRGSEQEKYTESNPDPAQTQMEE